jgi:peptidoglycan/LPS O-acetylase OafA/YrhL
VDDARPEQRLPVLDLLRAASILVVVAYHLPVDVLKRTTVGPVLALGRNGGLGVWIFFTVSGFIITRNLLRACGGDRRRIDLRDFYRRRVARLVPLALIVVFVSVAAALFLPDSPAKVAVFGRRDALDPWVLVGILTATLNVVAMAYGHWRAWGLALGVFWSLSVEEQFYFVFPWAFRRFDPRVLRAMLWVLVAAGPIVRIVIVETRPQQLFQVNPLSCFDGIAVGILLAHALEHGNRLGARLRAALTVAGGLVIAATLMLPVVPLWFSAGLMPTMVVAGAAGVIYGAAEAPLSTPAWLGRPGELCYGIYLLHAPLLFVLRPLIDRVHPVIGLVVWIAVTIDAAVLSYRFIEGPANRWVRTATAHRGALAGA